MGARPLATIALLACALSGCGSHATPARFAPAARPADAVRGFYEAAVRDGDFGRACVYASSRFFLKPSRIAGANVRQGDPRSRLRPPPPAPLRGPCPALARYVNRRFLRMIPSFRYWKLDSVKVAPSGKTADAVTEDGSAGLVLEDGQWRLLWVFR